MADQGGLSGVGDRVGDGVGDVSIVLASRLGEGDERACLAALESQLHLAHVILVRDADGGEAPPPWARLHVRRDGLVPELWAEGLRSATGEIVAFLATTSIPGERWVQDVVALHRQGHLAVGGPIEPGESMRHADWAVYFCRYAPYMLPIDDPHVEMAADNGSYRREVLERHVDRDAEGFLEPFVHAAMRSAGIDVTVQPRPVVRLAGGLRLRPFYRHRFRHGREHGRQRSVGLSRPRVAAAALSAPAVPLLMTVRAGRLVFRKRRLRGRFVLTSPLVFACYTAWAAGELAGRLHVVLRGRR